MKTAMFEELLESINTLVAEVRASNETMRRFVGVRTTDEQPLDCDGAATYLGLHPQTVRKLAKSNRLTYCRIGEGDRQPLRFLKRDLDAFLNKSRIESVD